MDTPGFRKNLIAWFRKNQRPLPWRKVRTPYRTWISEMMLQQTQVKTVLPYFDRWMTALPSIRRLAQTPEHKVLALWQGLGYYSRARQIKKAAAFIVKKYGGKIPETYEEILEVPGIGPYSAGAILSLAYDKKVPIVDGNVLRVLARVFAIKDPVDRPSVRNTIRDLEASLLPEKGSGEFNEALMELGALICTPRQPACLSCPVQSHCQAFKKNLVEALPVKTKKGPVQKVSAYAVILERNGRFLLHKRPVGKIMGGLWEFPEWKEELKSPPKSFRHVTTIKRHYTRFAEELNVFRASIDDINGSLPDWERRWLRASELAAYPLTSAHAKIRNIILKI